MTGVPIAVCGIRFPQEGMTRRESRRGGLGQAGVRRWDM